jgi:hypothetical protein
MRLPSWAAVIASARAGSLTTASSRPCRLIRGGFRPRGAGLGAGGGQREGPDTIKGRGVSSLRRRRPDRRSLWTTPAPHRRRVPCGRRGTRGAVRTCETPKSPQPLVNSAEPGAEKPPVASRRRAFPRAPPSPGVATRSRSRSGRSSGPPGTPG